MEKNFRILYRNENGLNCVFCCVATSQNLAIEQLWKEHPETKRPVTAGNIKNPIISVSCKLN